MSQKCQVVAIFTPKPEFAAPSIESVAETVRGDA